MTLPIGETTLNGTTLAGLILPDGSETVTEHVITVDTTPVAKGDTTVSLTAGVADVDIKAGQSLSFNASSPTGKTQRKHITFKEDVTLGTTAVSATIFPSKFAIPANDVATYVDGLIPIVGMQEFGLSTNAETVDTTDTLSGIGTRNVVVRRGYDFQISCIERLFDQGLEQVVKRLALDPSYSSSQGYFVLNYPDGSGFKGAARILDLSMPGNQNEVKRVEFTLQFQGEPTRIDAYTFA